jgi:hypothetical protein
VDAASRLWPLASAAATVSQLPVERAGGLVPAGCAGVEGFTQVPCQRRVAGVKEAQGALDAGGDGFAGFFGVVAETPGPAAAAY